MFGRRRRVGRGDGEQAERKAMYESLRSMALGAAAEALPSPPAEHPDVSGVIVDIPAEGGYATVVALTDNTTSLYTSTGGGTIGAGEQASVAAVTHRLLAAVQAHLGSFSPHRDDGLPGPGSVRFHVLGADGGGRCADVTVDAFWGRLDHELMPVIAAVQEVITAIREITPR